MSFIPYSSVTSLPKFPYTADASTAFTKGYLLYRDTSTGELKEATTTTGDATNIEAICAESITTGASDVELEGYPIHDGMLVVADCTNNTAANQLNKAHLLTNGGTVNNTSTHSTDINAIFIALAIQGEAADKKLIGRIVRTGQVTA